MKQKTVVITGAHGFLGRYVAKHFEEEGCYVIGLGHGSWSQQEWKNWGLDEWHSADVTVEKLLLYARIPDILIHCAGSGSVQFSVHQPALDFERTVRSTSQVLEFLRQYAPSARLVYPSSAAVYGAAPELPIKETAALKPVSPYGVHKLMAEDLCRMYSRTYGMANSIVRLFSIYGPELRKQILWDACGKFLRNELVFGGTGEESRDWLHAIDAANLISTAAREANSDCPTVNGGNGSGVTVREILTTLGAMIERPGCKVHFSGQQRSGDPLHLVADVSKAIKWGWRPRVLMASGLKEYAKWYLDEL